MSVAVDSLGEHPRTTLELREHWAGYWEDIVDELTDESLETIDGQPNLRNAFRKDTSLGQSERAIAEDHPNREILELLQNARDEAQYADQGRVFLAVTDDGLLIANNGRSFNFHNRAVEEAATGIGKTSKDTPEEIGKMGIGLKSILGKGESFEVWTKAPDANGDQHPLRVRFSKSYLLAAILNTIGYDHGVDELEEEFNTDAFPVDLDLSRESGGHSPAELNPNNRRALMELFLFAYPVPLSLSARRTELASLADYLVHGNDRVSDPNETLAAFGGKFTTAVFVEFEDSSWRSIVKDLYDVQSIDELSDSAIEESGLSTTDPDRVWQYADGTRSESLDPETLVHFETIHSLDAVRVSNNIIDAHITWTVNRADGVLENDRLSHTKWKVRQTTRDEKGTHDIDHVYDGFRLPPDERQHATQILVPRPPERWPEYNPTRLTTESEYSLQNYPLYLYYPISYRDPGLSFSLHGKFAVTPNRQDLKDGNQRSVDYNRRVMDEAIELIGHVAKRTSNSLGVDQHWQCMYPWILIPTNAHKEKWNPESPPSETTELLGYLRDGVIETLRKSECIPQIDGPPVAPSSIQNNISDKNDTDKKSLLLDWNLKGWDGIRAVYLLSQQLPIPSDSPLEGINRPLGSELEGLESIGVPSADRMWGLTQLQSETGDHLNSRMETLLSVTEDNQVELTVHLRDLWVRFVSQVLTDGEVSNSSTVGIQCPAPLADAVLTATARYFKKTSSSEIDTLLRNDYATLLDGVYLLPAQLDSLAEDTSQEISNGGQEEHTRILLQTENQEIRSEGNRRQPLSRTVLWNIPEENTDVVVPPEEGRFTVFFLAELAEENNDVASLLDEAGDPWGIRKYQNDRQEYFRSLIASFDTNENSRISATALGFIAERVDEFTADDLNTLPDGYVAHELLETILKTREYDRLRTRFRLCNTRLDLFDETNFASARISDFHFGPEWWPYLRKEPIELTDSGEEGEVPSFRDNAFSEDMDVTGKHSSVHEYSMNSGFDEESRIPSPFDSFWEPVYDEMNATDQETAAQNIGSTLAMFGVGITPTIRAVCHHGPGLQEPKSGVTKASWKPQEWKLPGEEPYRTDVDNLKSKLEGSGIGHNYIQYLDYITGPGNHPSETATHKSVRCHKRPYTSERGYGARVSSWIWSDDIQQLAERPDAVLDWLIRHEDILLETVLETGWYCDGNGKHKQRSWSSTIPTLFNWQIRNAIGFPSLFDDQFSDWLDDSWGADATRLRWAVSGEGQPEVTQLLPVISPDEEIGEGVSTSILKSLGVEPVGELNAVQAADRLQKIQSVLSTTAGDPLPSDHPVPMRTEGVESAWMYVYTELLRPIMDTLSDPDRNGLNVLSSGLLTHLPFRYKEREWRAVPISIIQSNSELEFKYHSQRSLRQWEKQEARGSESLYLLKPPTRGGIKPLADALEISSLEVEKPILDMEDLDGVTSEGLQPVKQNLKQRTEWILATLNRTNPDNIRESRDELQDAIDHLVMANLDRKQTEDFFDRKSRLYRPYDESDDVIGIVLNENELDGKTTDELIKATAVGIAFLFEMPGRYEEIQPALRSPLGNPDELKREWEQRGHDPDLVSSALGTHDLQELLRDISRIHELITRLGGDPPDNIDKIRSNLTDTDSTTIQRLRNQIQDPQTNSHTDQEHSPVVSSTAELLYDTASELPDALNEASTYSFFECILCERTAPHELWLEWCEILESRGEDPGGLLEWVAKYPRYVSEEWLPSVQGYWCSRLEQVCILRDVREDENLATLAGLEDALPTTEDLEPVEWSDSPVNSANFSDLEISSTATWFTVAPREVFENRALSPLIGTISSQAPADKRSEVAEALRDFVINGEVPSVQVDSRTRQQNAFSDMQSQLDGTVDLGIPDFSGKGKTEVRTFGKSGDGADTVVDNDTSSRTFSERGERAEAAAVLQILQRLSQWLASEGNNLGDLIHRLEGLRTEQNKAEYKWHTKNRWNGSLERFLNTEFSDEDYRSFNRFATGNTDLWEDPLVQVLNSTQEHGLGFDFIDPFGTITGRSEDSDVGIEITPVEVKAGGLSHEGQSVSFRFSTHQLRQAQAFVSAGYNYVIRIFAVPDLGTDEWLNKTKLVDEIILNQGNPPSEAFGTNPGNNSYRIIPAEAVAGGEMYIERNFEQ